MVKSQSFAHTFVHIGTSHMFLSLVDVGCILLVSLCLGILTNASSTALSCIKTECLCAVSW